TGYTTCRGAFIDKADVYPRCLATLSKLTCNHAERGVWFCCVVSLHRARPIRIHCVGARIGEVLSYPVGKRQDDWHICIEVGRKVPVPVEGEQTHDTYRRSAALRNQEAPIRAIQASFVEGFARCC